jgi:hypothetical protein
MTKRMKAHIASAAAQAITRAMIASGYPYRDVNGLRVLVRWRRSGFPWNINAVVSWHRDRRLGPRMNPGSLKSNNHPKAALGLGALSVVNGPTPGPSASLRGSPPCSPYG